MTESYDALERVQEGTRIGRFEYFSLTPIPNP